MKTKYKFIHFKEWTSTTWIIYNRKHKNKLGEITFTKDWKRFVFVPQPETIWSSDCLRDIADFLDQLQKEKKADKVIKIVRNG